MQNQNKKYIITILTLVLFFLVSLSCRVTGSPKQMQSTPVVQIISITQLIPITQIVFITETSPALNIQLEPEIILKRLNVSFLGQDGKKVIGSGCPGTDGKGAIIDNHFVVGGVDENKEVQRVLVAGDNSTLTWASPCGNNWALVATNLGNGIWEIFIAPSLPSQTYTVFFFYTDATLALGMVSTQ